MPDPLLLKLRHGASLTHEDEAILRGVAQRRRQVGPRQDLIREGDAPDSVHLVLEGIACRYKGLPDGQRSIMALLLPGDLCDLHVAILGEMDHAIATLSPCTIVDIPRSTVETLTERHPRITRALWWASLVDEGVLREWLVNHGRREAEARTAHLFCELLVRLRTVGLADETGYDLPLTQVELADVLSMSAVHMNRTLRVLREAKLIEWQGQRLTILDAQRLAALADFTPNYLHLTGRPAARGESER